MRQMDRQTDGRTENVTEVGAPPEKRPQQRCFPVNIAKFLGTPIQFVIFKPLSYCSKETIDVKALFASRPVSHLIR